MRGLMNLVVGTILCAALLLVVANPTQAQEKTEKSLYERLGGLPAISVVVSDFLDAMVPDSVLNLNPAIDAAREKVPKAYLTYHVTAMVCMATGGPCQYQGQSMKASHAHLNITEAEWGRMEVIMKEVFDKHNVPAKEFKEVMAIVQTLKADIVTAK